MLQDLHLNVNSQQQAKGNFLQYLSKHKLTVPPGFVAKFVFEPGMKRIGNAAEHAPIPAVRRIIGSCP